MWRKLFGRFSNDTIDTDIRRYESLLQGNIGQLSIDHNSGFEHYKQSEHPHPAVVKAWPVFVNRHNFSKDRLAEAKRKLSKAEYYALLQTLVWRYLQEANFFSLWRQVYAQEDAGLAYSSIEFAAYGPLFDSAVRSPYDYKYELPERIPETLYMHHHILEYPKMDFRDMFANNLLSEKQFSQMEKVSSDLAKEDGPRFWGRLDGIYAIRYHARQAHLPTNGIVNSIREYYENRRWKPLEFDLIYPYWKNGLYDGWKGGCLWTQFWINDADDVICVNLFIGNSRGEVTVFVLYCPHEFAKDTLAHYRSLHPAGAESTGKLDIPDYENFKVYPIPPFDYGLSPEVLSFRDKIWPLAIS